MARIAVTPYSTEDRAIAALDHTLAMMAGGATPVGTVDGERIYDCTEPGFLVWAIKRQGYAKEAREVSK